LRDVFLLDCATFALGDIKQPFEEHLVATLDLVDLDGLLVFVGADAVVVQLVLHMLVVGDIVLEGVVVVLRGGLCTPIGGEGYS